MQAKNLHIVFVVTALFATTSVFHLAAAGGVTVNQTADKITITGGKGKKIVSEKFALSKDGWYVIKISYTGPAVSVCQLSLVTQELIEKKQTIGGALTIWMGPNTTEQVKHVGSLKSDNYMIYADEAGGPWTVEILKNPKPIEVSHDTTFSGTADKVTPFFHLKNGSAKFTMHQKRKGQFSSRLQVELINADTGAFVDYLCHNATEPTLTATAEIKAEGNYVLAVSGGDSWDVSFTQ